MQSSGFVPAALRIALQAAFVFGAGHVAAAQTVSMLSAAAPSDGSGATTTASPLMAGVTVINMVSSGTVSTDLNNSAVAMSNGGLFAGAVSAVGQQASNQLNIYGTLPLGAAGMTMGPLLGGAGQSVTLNMTASASASSPVSMTINNLNASVSAGTNQIVGANAGLNALWFGGYGATASGAAVGGAQSGGNSLNGAAMAFAPGTMVTLSQTGGSSGGGVASLPNMSTVNTMLGYAASGSASVGGLGVSLPGAAGQSAGNSVNVATVSGMASLNVQQVSASNAAATTQAVNRALALSAPSPVMMSVH